MRVDCGIANIPLFRIDVPLISKSIQFGTKTIKKELDNKVELREILGPLYLSLGQHLGSEKVLKVFMIYKNVNGIGQTF